MQFIPTTRESQEDQVNAVHIQEVVDPKVGAILERSCADCHSNQTRWPWYSNIAPVSWILSSHVSKGRAKLNFSEWTGEPQSTNARMEICDAVSNGSMPLRGYTLLHRDARLSEPDIDLICSWASSPAAQASAQQPTGTALTAERRQNAVPRTLPGGKSAD
jgi:hypothetical protein